MKNKYFPDEEITMNDLYFVCYMIERVARHIKQKNKYVVNAIGKDELYHLLSCASTLHCENPEKVEHSSSSVGKRCTSSHWVGKVLQR